MRKVNRSLRVVRLAERLNFDYSQLPFLRCLKVIRGQNSYCKNFHEKLGIFISMSMLQMLSTIAPNYLMRVLLLVFSSPLPTPFLSHGYSIIVILIIILIFNDLSLPSSFPLNPI